MCTSISVSLAYPTFICCHCNVNKNSCLYNCHHHTVCKNHHHASNHNPPLENPSSHSSPPPHHPSILETEGQVLVCSSTRDSAPCPSWCSINRYWFSDIQSVVSADGTYRAFQASCRPQSRMGAATLILNKVIRAQKSCRWCLKLGCPEGFCLPKPLSHTCRSSCNSLLTLPPWEQERKALPVSCSELLRKENFKKLGQCFNNPVCTGPGPNTWGSLTC